MDIKCKNFDASNELHFHLSEAIWLAMFRAFERSPHHQQLVLECSENELCQAFYRFVNEGRKQDKLFRYVSGYVLGAGQV